MKKLISISIFLFAVLFVQGVYAIQNKVTICHATESNSNPWVRIVVAPQAIGGHFFNNGTPKAGHEDDILYQGEVQCPSPTVAPTATPTPTDQATPTPTPTREPELTPTPTQVPPQGPSLVAHRSGTNDGHYTSQSCPHLPAIINHFSVEQGTPNDNTLHIAWPIVLHTEQVDILYTDTVPGDWKHSVIDLPNTGSYDVGALKNGQHYWFTLISKSGCGATRSNLSVDPLP
jgi:hypothetical protein